MRFFMKAIIVLAGVTALFASSAEAASFFDATASRSHVSNIRNHIESNHNALVSGIRALGSGLFHSEALSDCIAVNVPQLRSGNINKVKACLSISGSATFDQSCAADLTGASCSLAISLASNAWIASGDTGIPTGIPGFPPTGLPGGNDNSNPGSGSGSGPSSQCISALSDYSTAVFTKCASALSKLGGVVIPTGSPAGSPPPIDAIISAQCSVMSSTEFGDCKAAISATANVQTACPDFGIGEIKSKISANILSAIDGPMAALCVKDDADASKYCLAAVMPSFAALGDKDFDPSKATDRVLAGICKPCVKSIVNKIAAFGGKFGGSLSEMAESLRFFNVLCAKDPTNPSKYCINVFASISALAAKASKSTSPSDVPTDSDFAPICSPCLKALIVQTSSLKAFDAEETQTLIALEKACNKDQTGKYCGPAIYSAVPSMFLSLSGRCTAGSTTCSVECKAAVQTIYDTQCCAVTIGFQGIIGAISQSPASAAVIPTLRAAAVCAEQITTATTCPVNLASIPVDLSLPNIAFTATSKNFTASLALKIALQKDLALALGVDASAIIVGDFVTDNANKGGVKVSITISVDASFKASYVSTLNQQMQQQGGLPLANTAQAAEQNNAALVQGEPMTASGQGPTSGAVKNGASILSITTAIIVAFLSRL